MNARYYETPDGVVCELRQRLGDLTFVVWRSQPYQTILRPTGRGSEQAVKRVWNGKKYLRMTGWARAKRSGRRVARALGG